MGRGVLPPCSPGSAVFMPTPRFDVIVVDLPWSYGRGADRGRSRNANRHYKTVGSDGDGEVNRKTGRGVDALIALAPVVEMAGEDAHLYLWATNPKLPFAFNIMRAWGFDYKTTLTWVKVRQDGEPIRNGMGWFFRGCTEHVLVGVKGSKPIPSAIREPNVIHAARTGHSRKPDAFYSLVDRVSPGRRVDMFCRGVPRDGWWGWGDEAEDFMTRTVKEAPDAE